MPVRQSLSLSFLREQTIGIDTRIQTPFGERLLVYGDFTASGRQLGFIESYLRELAVLYANSHTEDSLSGRITTRRLREAERRIKDAVNAGPDGRVIACGTGSTGAIHKLQEILGVALPPATSHFLLECLGEGALGEVRARQPVVFVGPYEHHSNEVTWREGLATVVEVDLDDDGGLDLADLERLLKDERYQGRPRIGSFSAASNVTGVRTPVHEVAALLHAHGAIACFDFAAAAPYVEIDMNPSGWEGGALDAVFLSPHKFLGGPGSCGLLIFNERIYPRDLAPSVSGGGTVVYVNPESHAFVSDVEEREKAGTPGIMQTLRAALALDVKAAVGCEAIAVRERELLERAFARWAGDERIQVFGTLDPERRIGIVSLNVADGRGGWLHPRFVTTLLDDLFGIQTRAGCSCAGPYAHRILGIAPRTAARLMALSAEGFHGIKPGWVRVGFHFTMDDPEADYVIDAVSFVAEHGASFLPEYAFNVRTGTWAHRDAPDPDAGFSLDAALAAADGHPAPLPSYERRELYQRYLEEARVLADARRSQELRCASLDAELEPHRYFSVAEGMVMEGSADEAFCGGF